MSDHRIADIERRLGTMENTVRKIPVRQATAAPPAGTLPKGQYQFMYYGMVSQNQAGFMPIYASPIAIS